MKKTVVILRGVSGAGKSTLTQQFLAASNYWVAVSADYFFLGEHGQYNFDATKLGAAHQFCKDEFSRLLWKHPKVEGIVVDNTNVKPREFQWYIDEATKAGATIISLIVENRHGNKDIHGCPQDTRDKQEFLIRQSLKLQ